MIRFLIVAVAICYGRVALATESTESVAIKGLRVEVFEQQGSKLSTHQLIHLDKQEIVLTPGKALIPGEEGRWVGEFTRDFAFNGKPFLVKIAILKLKMASKDAADTVSLLVGLADGSDDEDLTVATLDELDSISGRRHLRLDTRYFQPGNSKPFKLVAGVQY
jgi:hypothetical protein